MVKSLLQADTQYAGIYKILINLHVNQLLYILFLLSFWRKRVNQTPEVRKDKYDVPDTLME